MSDLDKWVEYLKDEEKSKHTIDSYNRDVIQFMDFIQKEPEELNKEDVEFYKNHMYKNSMSIKSINRKLVSIKGFFTFLNTELDRDINVKIKQEKLQKQDYLEEMLNVDDFYKIVAAAKAQKDFRAIAIFNGLYLTGMRVSELLQLKVTDINSDAVMIKGKGSKYRNVYITEKLKAIFRDYLIHRISRPTPLLFTGKTGTTGAINRQTVDVIIKQYATLAGVSITKAHAHNFRHLFCLSLIDKGLSIDTVADLAGHSDINTTRIYTRKTKGQLMDTINGL